MKARTGLAALAALVALPLVGILGWATTDTMIHATSTREFCSGCHTMEPMALAYDDDVHGGNHPMGIRVVCTGCHLPHDGSLTYLLAKGHTGLHDVWAEFVGDPTKVDWFAMRERREDYVYDSACLACHSDLERATSANPRAFVAHKPYFLGAVEKKCVSCHENVGHHNLEDRLNAALKQREDSP